MQLALLTVMVGLPTDMRNANHRPLWPPAVGVLAQARDADGAMSILIGHTAPLTRAVFSPDGTRVVTASHDHTAKLWDARNGASLATLTGHVADVLDVTFSPNGAYILTASADKTARLWDARTGTALIVLAGHTGLVEAARFSPDGSHIVTVSHDQTARVWDASTESSIALDGHADLVSRTA
jgi:WD40 repeat protein